MKNIFLIILLSFSAFASPSFKQLFEKQNIVILLIDPQNGKIVDANPKAVEFYGYSKQELTSKKIDQINTLTKKQVKQEMALAKSQNRDYFIFKHRLKNQKIKTVEVRSNPYKFENKQLLVSFIQDLSKLRIEQDGLFHYQKRLEEDIAKKTQEIEAFYQKEQMIFWVAIVLLGVFVALLTFLNRKINRTKKIIELDKVFQETLIESMHNALIATNKDGTIIRFNKSAEKLLGYEASELINKKNIELFHDKQQIVQRAKELRKELNKDIKEGIEVFTIKDSLGLENTNEWIYIRKDSSKLDVELTVTQLKNKDEVFGYIGIATDITQRKQAQYNLENAKIKAEIANKHKSEFLANMSHEIRTPMNAIIGLSEMLGQMKQEKEQKKLIEKINSSSKILLGIINDILDYSKIEAGKLELEYVQFSLNHTVSQLWVMFEQVVEQKNISLKINEDKRLPNILTNLLSNAIKFTQEGSVTLSINLKKRVDSTHAVISFSVEDTGVGMTQEQSKKLFQPFSQADSSTTRKYGGTGLGLVISKNIIKALGGKIKLESKQNKGTVVSFDLYMRVKQWERKENKSIQKVEEPSYKSLKGLEILLVEDNEVNQLVAKMMLEKVGIKVEIASDGQEGVDKYQANPNKYHLILMDLQMPVLSGYDATTQIRKVDKSIPIIALTAAAMIEDKQKALDAGMNEHLSKPIDKKELFKIIEQYYMSY